MKKSFFVLGSAFLFLSSGFEAQQVQPGAYTAQQATAGRAVYQASCAGCHLPDLAGSNEAPQLAGVNFRNDWRDQQASALQDRIQKTMPPGGPSVSATDAANIT